MRYVKGSEVFTATGEKVGTVSRVVIDAKTKDVTDLVVERGVLEREEKVIPIGLVNVENEDRILLRETNQSVDDLADYETTHYVPIEKVGAPYQDVDASYWYPPVGYQIPMPRAGFPSNTVPEEVPVTETSLPEGRIAIAEGVQVVSADDHHIGNVEQVITDDEGNTVTHFVIGRGFLLKEHKMVPADWVTGMKDDQVRLSVDANLFDRLPDYNPD
jgi:uncharacterized protein YrrD